MKVIINVGVSGAGKSTWSKEYIKQNERTVRINRDDIRRCLKGGLDGYYKLKTLNPTEDLINKLEEYMLIQAFLKNFDVIIDNTNLKPSYINRWLDFIEYWNDDNDDKAEVFFKVFPENNPEVLKSRVRVRERSEGSTLSGNEMNTYLNYIDKQVANFEFIKRHIEVNHKNQIFNG